MKVNNLLVIGISPNYNKDMKSKLLKKHFNNLTLRIFLSFSLILWKYLIIYSFIDAFRNSEAN